MRNNRQTLILSIIEKYNIETQEELAEKLLDIGIEVTQATISRDIKELGLIKVASEDGKYRYRYMNKETDVAVSKLIKVFSEAFVSIDFASNIIVIKTLPGMGQAAASVVDNLGWNDVVGTVAGDDTIFVAVRREDTAKELVNKFKRLIS